MTTEERRTALLRLTAHAQEVAAAQTTLALLLAVPSEEPLWDAKRTAEYLNMSPEWVRDHGAALGIEVDLGKASEGGREVHRYAPERVRALRETRKRAEAARLVLRRLD